MQIFEFVKRINSKLLNRYKVMLGKASKEVGNLY